MSRMILNIGGIVIALKCCQRAENAQSTVARKMNTVYNETITKRGVLDEERETGDSGNKWFSKKIPGESDTESNSAYGKTEERSFRKGRFERTRGSGMDGQDSEGRRISERNEKKVGNDRVYYLNIRECGRNG